MFESALSTKLKNIFDFDKVTFDSPSESQEQEGVFVEVESSRVKVGDKYATARVTGKIRIFAQAEKMPFDYLMKQIDKADPDDKKDLFFFDIGLSQGRFLNIDERTIGFVFFFNSQYNPNLGTIETINITVGD